MRVYIPASIDDLALQACGQWEPQYAFALTEAFRDSEPELDEDELADAAIDVAAMTSALQLGSRLRAVFAADVSRADAVAAPGDHPAAIVMNGTLDPASIACVFLDEEDAAADVTAARGGDAEAQERLAERSLLWYDVRELIHD